MRYPVITAGFAQNPKEHPYQTPGNKTVQLHRHFGYNLTQFGNIRSLTSSDFCIVKFKQKKMQKTIFITGASAGLGRATAKLFQSRGWNVIATMRNPENETELTKLANVTVLKLDLTSENQIDNMVKTIIKKYSVDVVLNNADNKNKLRYIAGTDAIELYEERGQLGAEGQYLKIKRMFDF